MRDENQTGAAIATAGLGKRYGEQWALRDFDLEVPTGTVLGPPRPQRRRQDDRDPDPHDPRPALRRQRHRRRPRRRRRIGPRARADRVDQQAATVDGLMSAGANLEMIGRLYHLPRRVARERAGELLKRLDLSDAADKLVRDFSGGMRRRLDLAASLVAAPPVLFLDEPTTGLDPESRNDLWALLRDLVNDGTTLLLTTQYLEEADRLADRIVLLDHGQVAATGSPSELKARHGGERIAVTVAADRQLEHAASALTGVAAGPAEVDREQSLVTAPASEATRLIEVVRALDQAGVEATDVHRREATLDDVFLSITRPNGKEASA
jgi:ABC-2 type transport system ATP-binding protein